MAVLMPVPGPLAATHGPSAAARKGVAAAASRIRSSTLHVGTGTLLGVPAATPYVTYCIPSVIGLY
jgi:hypothetical protein